jgi:hypothetical protein
MDFLLKGILFIIDCVIKVMLLEDNGMIEPFINRRLRTFY